MPRWRELSRPQEHWRRVAALSQDGMMKLAKPQMTELKGGVERQFIGLMAIVLFKQEDFFGFFWGYL